MRVNRSFYHCETAELAKKLLGCILCRQVNFNGESYILKGRIVETEAYPGGQDGASHSFNGRRTPGNEPMYMSAGTTYVYFTYGMYYCMNISSGDEGGAVLLRALEPLNGKEVMHALRSNDSKTRSTSKVTSEYFSTPTPQKRKKLDDKDLCSGPAKLCLALDIQKENINKQDLVTSQDIWVEDDGSNVTEIIATSPRIGIGSRAGIHAFTEYRFFLQGNPFVSRPSKSIVSTSKTPVPSRRPSKRQTTIQPIQIGYSLHSSG